MIIDVKTKSRINKSGTGCGNIKLGSKLEAMDITDNPIADDGFSPTEGTWAWSVNNSGDLVASRYESGAWVSKGGFTAV
jgi:hypothetical protein